MSAELPRNNPQSEGGEQGNQKDKELTAAETQYKEALKVFYLGMTTEEIVVDKEHTGILMRRLDKDLITFQGATASIDTSKEVAEIDEGGVQTRTVESIIEEKRVSSPEYTNVLEAAVAMQQEWFASTEPEVDHNSYDIRKYRHFQWRMWTFLKWPYEGIAWSQEDADRIKMSSKRKIDEEMGTEVIAFADSFREVIRDTSKYIYQQEKSSYFAKRNAHEKLDKLFTEDENAHDMSEQEQYAAQQAKQVQKGINAIDGIPRIVKQTYLYNIAEQLTNPKSIQ